MNIKIWSDYTCPYCYIGKAHIAEALKQAELTDVTIELKSYQLAPDAKPEPGLTIFEYLGQRQGMTKQQIEDYAKQLSDHGKEAGVVINLLTIVPTNTMDAHRLTHFAATQNKASELADVIYKAHFEEGKDISDHSILTELAVTVGLEKDQVDALLSSDEYQDIVLADQQQSSALGAQGVPFFLFNNKFTLSGAQPVETFVKAFEQIAKQSE